MNSKKSIHQSAPKIIVVGASGYIGSKLLSKARSQYIAYGTSTFGTGGLFPLRLEACDNFDYRLISAGDFVIVMAAISSPDFCARETARARAVNVVGSSEFINRVIACGARIVFFSSDTVYGEAGNIIDEGAITNPAGEYAEMKAEIEKCYAENTFFKSIRLSYVFSKEDKFTKYLIGCAARGEEADIFDPFLRAIVHRSDVVDGVLALAKSWDSFPQRVINFGGPAVLSRVDFAKLLKKNLIPSLKMKVTQPEAEFFKNRPRIIAMSSEILPKLLGRSPKTLEEAIQLEFN